MKRELKESMEEEKKDQRSAGERGQRKYYFDN